ncbi:hypothetical protein C922_02278 [Plasmodium inui San Antonio 1]|uniref:Uncharacterized protein n=1 Tax=Plasmodium inui San Antonio 1 TaxID=1237626 RepID=W7A7A0_9APIC|nr:hypothetical protein C922_02278 [Plasmodium inui San Antonio 1]EUD67128.1 hypothetical protein C922_02278 [Plasmodium inui San Antonio 1]
MDQEAEQSRRGNVDSNGNHAYPSHYVSSSKYINGPLYKKSKDVSMQNGNVNGFIMGGPGAPIEYQPSTVRAARFGEEDGYFDQNECKGGIPNGDGILHMNGSINGGGSINGNGLINGNGHLNGSNANHLLYSYPSDLGTMMPAFSSHHVNGNIDLCHKESEGGAEVTENLIGSVNSINESMHPHEQYDQFCGVQEGGYPGSPFDGCDKPIPENLDVGFISSMKSSGKIHFGNGNIEEADEPSQDCYPSQSNGTNAPGCSGQVTNGYSENKRFSNKTDGIVQMKKKKNVTFTIQNDVFSIPPGLNEADSFGYYANGVMASDVSDISRVSRVSRLSGMPNGDCVAGEEKHTPDESTKMKKTHGSAYGTINEKDATNDVYNFITLKKNNHSYHPNSINNNYIEYDINNNGPFFPSMSTGLKSGSTMSSTFGANEGGGVRANADHHAQAEGDISSTSCQAMQHGTYSTGPHDWVYKQGDQRENQPGIVPNVVSARVVNGDVPGEAPISDNPVSEQEAKPGGGGATFFVEEVPNASDTTANVNAMYDSSSYNCSEAKWKGLPFSGGSMNNRGANRMPGRGGVLNKNDKSATINGKVKQTKERHKGSGRPKSVSFSKKLVSNKSNQEKKKLSKYPSNSVNRSGGDNQPHRFGETHPHTLSANMLPQDGPLKHGVHTGHMGGVSDVSGMNDIRGMSDVSQSANEMVHVQRQFVMRYLSDVEKIYQIRERIRQHEKRVNKNRAKIRARRQAESAGSAAGAAAAAGGISWDSSNSLTLCRLNTQVDLYIDFVERREYRSDLEAQLRRWDGGPAEKHDGKEPISQGRSNVRQDGEEDSREQHSKEKSTEEQPSDRKVNDRRRSDGPPRAHSRVHLQSRFIQSLLRKKSNLYCSSPGEVERIHCESFYFQHALKQVNYLCNLLVYMHFILLKYVSIFSLSEWNALLFRDIDLFNCGSWGRSPGEAAEVTQAADPISEVKGDVEKALDATNEVTQATDPMNEVTQATDPMNEVTQDADPMNEVTETADSMNDALPLGKPGAGESQVYAGDMENEKSTKGGDVPQSDGVTENPGETPLDAETMEKLNPLIINKENTIDINYYEYVIEPFDFYFYENVYNEICAYVQMVRSNGETSGGAASNATAQLLKTLPYQYHEFVEILNKEIMNVRDLIYRNRYIRYMFYYIYRNNSDNLLDSVNHIFNMEKKKLQLYKLQVKLRYNIFLSRFFEHGYMVVNCPGEEKMDESSESCGVNFIEAKQKLFTCLFEQYREYYRAYQARVQRLREDTRKVFGIPEERFPYVRKKINFYSEHFEELKRRFALRLGEAPEAVEAVEAADGVETVEGGEAAKEAEAAQAANRAAANGTNMTEPHEREKLTFDVSYDYVEYMFNKNYALIINSEKNNSRKLKAAYIVNRNLKDRENLVIVTSILNVIKWKSLFGSFDNVTVYLNEESILDNKIETQEKNLIICVDFLPKILHVACHAIILDMSHFNLLNKISILNDLRYLGFSKRIIILNNVLAENWNLLSSLFFLNSALFGSTIVSRIQLSQSQEDRSALTDLMRSFVGHFCVMNKEGVDPQSGDRSGVRSDNQRDEVTAEEVPRSRNRRCFLITYMSGIQKFIYDNVSDEDKWDASVHPLLLLDENNFFLKDFNISEKFDLLKNILKKFHMLKKRILLCYSGKDKLEKLIKILLYVHLLNDASSVSSFDVEREKDSLNVQQYDVAVVVNNHIEYLTYFENRHIACYLLISAFTKEEEGILDTFKDKKEIHFYKKKKEELMRSRKSCRDGIYRYYINNMISENDEQFLLFSIIDQKEKVYCNTPYDEVVLPTCFVSTLAHCEAAVGYSEHWQDIKNAHSFWNFNNFNPDKVIFYLDRKNTVYDKYQNVVCPMSEEYIAPPQIYYYLTNPMNEKNTFNNCLSLAIDEIIKELNRKKELDEFDEMKKRTLLNIKEKTSKKYFSSIRKVEKILSEFLKENKKKSFERFLKGCESYGQVITKCKEKLFVTFNKTYNIHFKYFEDFWLDEEKKRKEKWRKLWDLHEAKGKEDNNRSGSGGNNNDNNNRNSNCSSGGSLGENNPGNGARASGSIEEANLININNVFNTTVREKNDSNDSSHTNDAFANSDTSKNELNFLEKKNFRIRLSSKLFDEKEFDQLFVNRKKICLTNGDSKKEDNNSCSLEEKKEKEKDKKTCLYIERKEGDEPCQV